MLPRNRSRQTRSLIVLENWGSYRVLLWQYVPVCTQRTISTLSLGGAVPQMPYQSVGPTKFTSEGYILERRRRVRLFEGSHKKFPCLPFLRRFSRRDEIQPYEAALRGRRLPSHKAEFNN